MVIFLVLAVVYFVVFLTVLLIEDPTPDPDHTGALPNIVSEVKARLLPVGQAKGELMTNGLHYLYAATVLHSITFFGILGLLPVYLTQEVGVSEVLMGIFLAMNPGGRTAFMYVFGRVADVRGRKSMITWGLVGSGVFALVIAAATYPENMFHRKLIAGAGFLLMAMALSAYTVGSLAIMGDNASVNRESELMGLRDTAMGVGGVLGPGLFGVMVTLIDYELALIIWSLFAFFGAILVAKGLRETAQLPAATTG